MPALLVGINTADAGELARLYGIGPELARRIVADRQANGPFVTSDDLARVEGVSVELARTLAPHIDWRLPAQGKKREWAEPIIAAVAILVVLWIIRDVPADIAYAWQARDRGEPFTLVWLVGEIALLILVLSGTLALVLAALAGLATDRTRGKRLNRAALLATSLLMVAAVVLGIINAVYYQFYALGRWAALVGDAGTMAGFIVSVLVLIAMLPAILLLWRPALAYNAALARGVDMTFLLGALAMTAFAWLTRAQWPVFISVFFSLIGLLTAAFGYRAIRNGTSVLSVVAGEILPAPNDRQQANTSAWMTWLNNRLPDPEQQKELQQALEQAYPPSRTRTLIGLIIFGAGSWLVVTALGAIVEWVVQGWLGNLIR